MRPEIRILADSFRMAFTSPGSNPVGTAFVISILLIVLLIALLFVIFLLTPRRKSSTKVRRYRVGPASDAVAEASAPAAAEKDVEVLVASVEVPAEETGQETALDVAGPPTGVHAKTLRSALTGAAIAILLTSAVVSSYLLTQTDDYCLKACHSTQGGAAKIGHASCAACHQTPGFAGIVPNVTSRAGMLVKSLRGGTATRGAVVSSDGCMRCHASILGSVSQGQRGIRMSHSAPYDAGIACTECHPATGHSVRRAYSMSTCVSCHGKKPKLAACGTCHTADPYDAGARKASSSESTATLGSGKVSYPVVSVGNIGCGSCHNLKKSCDPCHGTRIPHSEAFVKGLHAREAAFGRKVACEKCHSPGWCSRCHVKFEQGHGPAWQVGHQSMGWNSNCGCHATRTGRTTPMCLLCHDRTR